MHQYSKPAKPMRLARHSLESGDNLPTNTHPGLLWAEREKARFGNAVHYTMVHMMHGALSIDSILQKMLGPKWPP